jgi:FMN phosphatase YigB (HAD superfamily)
VPYVGEEALLEPIAIYFDIGDTLAISKLSNTGALQELKVLPFVPEVLQRLKGMRGGNSSEVKLGVISNTGTETLARMRTLLEAADLISLLDSNMLLFSSVERMDKRQKSFFQLACTRAGVPPARCIFVGESEAERRVAESAGMRVSYHPLHVFFVLDQVMAG